MTHIEHELLPVEIIFNPRWWNKNCDITFDKEFFFDPQRRVEDERRMRAYLYERYGGLGLGERNAARRPVIGPVHLAAGFLLSNAFGCEVKFHEDAPPDVIPMKLTDTEIMRMEAPDFKSSGMMRSLIGLMDRLEAEYGYIEGDVNWSGVQNIALDIRGEELFIDYYEKPELVEHLMDVISVTLKEFVQYIHCRTGSSSISVNPTTRCFKKPVFLHSNCSVTMISNAIYEEFLLKYDSYLSKYLQPYGIHHCGGNMQVVAEGYSKVEQVCFFDVGAGSDIKACRKWLPDAFFNLRLSPVKMLEYHPQDVEAEIIRLVKENGSIQNAGICCINVDYGTSDECIVKMFETAENIKIQRESFEQVYCVGSDIG